jgi:hypothetical protein
MAEGIIHFELDGENVLGFDTGMDAKAFAQSKMAQLLIQAGCIIFPAGDLDVWKPSGVCEKGTTFIWGPDFPGESLDTLIRDAQRKDEALDAVRLWIKARGIIGEDESLCAGAQGVLIIIENTAKYSKGTLLFFPEMLVRRCIEAQGNEALIAAQQWVHPDLKYDEAIVFSAGAMLYGIFCGTPPFFGDDGEVLRQDIREGVFMPPELAVPGLDAALAKLITDAISPKNRPSVTALSEFLGNRGLKKIDSWFSPLSEKELAKIKIEQERHKKRRELKVKARRFVIRNTAIIIGCAALFLVIFFSIRGYVTHQAELPNTRGMTPIQVAETYYGAFANMDSTIMEGCVINKAGKGDINMVVNMYAVTKIRQAYEPTIEKPVFGVTGLVLKSLDVDESDGEVSVEANYTLWVPSNMAGDTENPYSEELANEGYVPLPPQGLPYTDILKIVYHKDSWRISEILRGE